MLASHDWTEYYFNPLPSREGRQGKEGKSFWELTNFNPLPSREGRHQAYFAGVTDGKFQSTPLTRGETFHTYCECCLYRFQSTPLTRGETIDLNMLKSVKKFQSTPLTRGETLRMSSAIVSVTHFNPLPSREGRQHKPPKILLDSRQSIQQKHHSSFF